MSPISNNNPVRMFVQAEENDGDITISTIYSFRKFDDEENDPTFITGKIMVREQDYENLLKALNKMRKWVKSRLDREPVQATFLAEK